MTNNNSSSLLAGLKEALAFEAWYASTHDIAAPVNPVSVPLPGPDEEDDLEQARRYR